MLKRLWKPVVGTAVLVGTPSYLYFKYTSHQTPPRESFDLPIRVKGANGKAQMSTRTLGLLTKEEVDRKLTEHAVQTSMSRDGVVWNQATAFVPANDPIEDANASEIVRRDAKDPSGQGDLLFFAVMDGHGGYDTSRLLSKVLIPAVALELHRIVGQKMEDVPQGKALAGLRSLLWPTKDAPPTISGPLDADPRIIAEAIQRAFLNLDSEIVDAPLRLLAEEMAKNGKEKQLIPDLSHHPMAQATLKPAMSGSCALMALFDTAHQNLYVACTGDSRAVAGSWVETEDGPGYWQVDVLTEDQTGRNPNELKRIQSEHPASENNTVVMRGRILGGLEPSRAFGDARYKWSRDAQAILNQAFMEGLGASMRSAPALLQTPPYVTARPVVTHRKFSLPTSTTTTSPSSESPRPKSSLRFIILATDGLWDELSSSDAVALVGGYLSGLKGPISKSTLPGLIPVSSSSSSPSTPSSPPFQGKSKPTMNQVDGEWTFEDENVSSHLIRNAFGGGDEDRVRQLVSIPNGLARNYRDDVTCTVVWWEEDYEKGREHGSGGVKVERVILERSGEKEKHGEGVKAKL